MKKHRLLLAGLFVLAGRAVGQEKAGEAGVATHQNESGRIVQKATRNEKKDASWIIGTGPDIVAVEAHKLSFIKLPADVSVGKAANNRPALFRRGTRTEPDNLSATKLLTFKHPVRLIPAENGKRLLVCSNPLSLNIGSGEFEDFCGIISNTGEIVYQFAFKQKRPNKIAAPIGINADGNYAEIAIGAEVEGEDHPQVGTPREVLAWSFPNELKKYSAPKDAASAWNEIRKNFRARTKK